jgi:hypothetical protein
VRVFVFSGDVSSVSTTKKAIFIVKTTTTRGGGTETTRVGINASDCAVLQKFVIIGQYIKVS